MRCDYDACHAARVATRLVPLAQHAPAARLGDRDKQVSWLAASASHHLPGFDPVVFDAWHTAYSCGGSPGFTRVPV